MDSDWRSSLFKQYRQINWSISLRQRHTRSNGAVFLLNISALIAMLTTIENTINFLLDATGKIATLLLILLVGVISFNVIARYAFDTSYIALEELSWHLYSSVFLLGMAYAVRTQSHVRVDIIYTSRSEKTKAIIDLVGTLILMLPFTALMMVNGFDFAKESYSFGPHADSYLGLIKQFFATGIGERSQDPGGLNNRFVIKSVIPLAFFLTYLSGISILINRSQVILQIANERKHSSSEDI